MSHASPCAPAGRLASVLITGVLLSAASGARPARAAERLAPLPLIEMARARPQSPEFREALLATLGERNVKNGTAAAGEGPEFLWAVEASTEPRLIVDDLERPAMTRLQGTHLWIETGQLTTGRPHAFHYLIDNHPFGGNVNLIAWGAEAYAHPGVPQGHLSERHLHRSKIYDGMESEYWTYVPAQYDPNKPAAVMVWNDGGQHVNRDGSRLQNVIDNLTAQGRIPVIVHIFINPGDISKSTGTPTYDYVNHFHEITGRTLRDAMRSTEYDTVTDRYDRFLRDEILAEVGETYHLRKDAYSHAIAGESSGGVAAFTAAWEMPDLFSRALTRVGTYTSIQWIPGKLDGGNILPFAVRKTPRKNFRIWLSDGCEDLENEHGSWPLQNIQLANSLKMQGYDFHFSFLNGSHSGAHGNAQAADSLTWLWRDYDPARTEQVYEQEELERTKPLFRVHIFNRNAE